MVSLNVKRKGKRAKTDYAQKKPGPELPEGPEYRTENRGFFAGRPARSCCRSRPWDRGADGLTAILATDTIAFTNSAGTRGIHVVGEGLYVINQDVGTANSPTFATATVGGVTLPSADGTAGQLPATDGAGTASWTSNAEHITLLALGTAMAF